MDAEGFEALGTLFVDGVQLWLECEPFESDAELLERVASLKRTLKRIGLKPGGIIPRWNKPAARGRGFKVSIAPVFNPTSLTACVDALELADARVTQIEIARDFLGVPAETARASCFPNLENVESHRFCIRGRTTKPGRSIGGTFYARLGNAARNLAAYSDRPSKLASDGPAVLHVELRLRGAHLPRQLRSPRALLDLLEREALLELWHLHVRPGRDCLLPRARARAR